MRSRAKPVDLSVVPAVIKPATKPRSGKLKLFVGASLPKDTRVRGELLERLQTRYSKRLEIKRASDGRMCIILPCKTAVTLAEAGRRADCLKRNISNLLGIGATMIACGYGPMCEKLDQPLNLAA